MAILFLENDKKEQQVFQKKEWEDIHSIIQQIKISLLDT
jgi:hypothetical protein